MSYLLIISLLVLATGALAGVNSCPYYDIPQVLCYENSDCAGYSQSYCKEFAGYGYGFCAAPERDCAADEICDKRGNNYHCYKDIGSTCTANSQCTPEHKCINGKCGCTNVPDYGSATCFVPNDSLGAFYGYTVCNNTNQKCITVSNKQYPQGSCVSDYGGPCDGGNECMYGSKCNNYECTCMGDSGFPKCKHYNKVKAVMIPFEECMRAHTEPCGVGSTEACCDAAILLCQHYITDMATLPNSNLAWKIKFDINYYLNSFGATSDVCNYRKTLSEQCGMNFQTASL